MARLLASEISLELRQSLAAASFTFTLATIPTGRDPRAFEADTDRFPAAVVQVTQTDVQPMGVGGALRVEHDFSIYLLFTQAAGTDLNLTKLTYGAELVDWVCTNKAGTHYKLRLESGSGIRVDYDPREEAMYQAAGQSLSMLRIDFSVQQKLSVAL